MRYQRWKQSLHLRAQRTPNKFSKSFSVNPRFSRFYNTEKSLKTRNLQLEERKIHASENHITKRTKEENDKNDVGRAVGGVDKYVELSRRYDSLRADQKYLEKQIKNRTTVLIKAVYRHKKSMKKIGELERTLKTYNQQLKQSVSNNVFRAAVEHSMNGGTIGENCNKSEILRTMGGSDAATDVNSDLMPTFVKKFALIRNYARRWMQKANIKRRHSSAIDPARKIKKQQRMSWDLKPVHETIAMQIKEPIKPIMTNHLHGISMYQNEKKRTESFKNSLAPSEVVDISEESSKLANRRKKLKTKQIATFDIDESAKRQRAGKRRSRGHRRSSRKSQQSTTSDGLKKGQRKRKGRRKSIKSLESLESTGQHVKQNRRSQSARKSRKRQSKEKAKLSKASQESGSHAGALQSANDEKIVKGNLMLEANLLQQIQSDTNHQFRALEKYCEIPLRADYTLLKLERLNNILDELIVEEEKKPPPSPKPVLPSREAISKPKKREMHGLEKLLILLKECKKCQRKQEKAKTSEQDCAVLCQREYHDAIRNAAGLPDYFPEDSDLSLICSCFSLT